MVWKKQNQLFGVAQKERRGRGTIYKRGVYNMYEFGTETMYDYYIAMKSMFLVVKLLSHPSNVYASFHHSHTMN
jgi:hypothetical protein